MGPTLADFQAWIVSVMGISTAVLPSASPSIVFAYDMALYFVPTLLQCVPAGAPLAAPDSLYTIAVYNLAGHNLLVYGVDLSGSSDPTYFKDARAALKLNSFVAGAVTAASDEGTSASFTEAEWAKSLTIDQLDLLKTPYGRTALSLMQSSSTIWGLS